MSKPIFMKSVTRMAKHTLIALKCVLLAACTNIDTADRVEGVIETGQAITNRIIEERDAAAAELVREAAQIAPVLRLEADRLERAPCYLMSLKAFTRYACSAGPEHRRQMERLCNAVISCDVVSIEAEIEE